MVVPRRIVVLVMPGSFLAAPVLELPQAATVTRMAANAANSFPDIDALLMCAR
jgi:hypothetical protein